jgi:hypothetical protein
MKENMKSLPASCVLTQWIMQERVSKEIDFWLKLKFDNNNLPVRWRECKNNVLGYCGWLPDGGWRDFRKGGRGIEWEWEVIEKVTSLAGFYINFYLFN